MTVSEPPTIIKEQALAALGQMPFSPILNRLVASLSHEDISFAKVADLIEKDAVLAGNILQMVNSPLYGLQGTVNSVRHAVSLLGVSKLRNTMIGMSMLRLWNQVDSPVGFPMAQFNQHSVAVAILSDLLAQRLSVNYAQGAFVAGLFHDLGLLLVSLGVPDKFEELSHLSRVSGRPRLECELEVLGFTLGELSADALAAWNLPEPIQAAVRDQEAHETSPTLYVPASMALSRLLNAADHYAKGAGITPGVFVGDPEGGECALSSLRLGAALPSVVRDFEDEFSALKRYF